MSELESERETLCIFFILLLCRKEKQTLKTLFMNDFLHTIYKNKTISNKTTKNSVHGNKHNEY